MILFSVTPMFFSVISTFLFVIPAQAGIHVMQDRSKPMDSRLRGNDRVRA
jgi:hypothetical protein